MVAAETHVCEYFQQTRLINSWSPSIWRFRVILLVMNKSLRLVLLCPGDWIDDCSRNDSALHFDICQGFSASRKYKSRQTSPAPYIRQRQWNCWTSDVARTQYWNEAYLQEHVKSKYIHAVQKCSHFSAWNVESHVYQQKERRILG